MLKKIRKDRDVLLMKYPASWHRDQWREAIPLGNGVMGASVYGAIKTETIILNHAALWAGGRTNEVPDISYALKETRQLMDEGKFTEASWHLTNKLKENGYSTSLAAPVPLGCIKIAMPPTDGFSDYLRSLDMTKAQATVDWTDAGIQYRREAFVSRADDVFVCRIRSSDAPVNATISLDLHKNTERAHPRYSELAETVEQSVCDNYIFHSATLQENNTDFGMVARVVADGGNVQEVRGALEISGADSILLLVKVFVNSKHKTEWDKLKTELEKLPADYDALIKRHIPLHKKLYKSASLRLGETANRSNEEMLLQAFGEKASPELLEKLWRFGRYAFICGTTPQTGLLFPMYGLWHGDYGLIWTHNMSNENVQMIYWHVNMGGLSETAQGFFSYYLNMMDDYKKNAKNIFGCRGIYVPAGSSPGLGKPNQIVPVITNWTGAAAWISQHFYQYYLYTKDKDFLIDKALPFMYETALFYEDFITFDKDGKIKFYPSVSPENTPQNFMPPPGVVIPHPMPTTINSTMDLALIKELFTNIMAASEEAGMYADKKDTWEKILNSIPKYKINKDGAVREWQPDCFEDRYDHRHLSHIYPVFPGYEINSENEPELFEAFEKAVNLRKIDAQTGWSLAHMSAIYSRFGHGDKAIDCLYKLARSSLLANLFTLHNDWRNMNISLVMESCPVQMDANMGIVNALQEMLMYSSESLVKLLPALPEDLPEGEVDNFVFCGGKASFAWNIKKKKFNASLTATRKVTIDIKMPKEFSKYKFSCNNCKITNKDKDVITVSFQKGGKITVN